MPSIPINLDLEIDISQKEIDKFSDFIQKEVIEQVYNKLRDVKKFIQKTIKAKIKTDFLNSPGVHELIYGTLRYDMGLRQDEANMITNQIANIISKDFVVQIKKEKDGINIIVKLIEADYTEILGLSGASFISRNDYKIDWLEWMLKRGDEWVVEDFRIKYVNPPNNPNSRSGGAFMIPGSCWRVPPEWSSAHPLGNFIVRCFSDIHDFIYREIEKVI